MTFNFSTMPSFDIASKVDLQTLDNAINIAKKEIDNRFDFKGTHVSFELDKKDSEAQRNFSSSQLDFHIFFYYFAEKS